MSASKFETTIELPSRAILYGDSIPAKITLRTMTTQDEKMIFGSNAPNAMSKMIQNCITSPKNLDIGELIPNDEHFILLKLRSHTYGPEYRFWGDCPHCGDRSIYDVDLDSLDVHYLDSEFKEPIEFELPDSGSKISVKILRKKDIDYVKRQSKKLAKQMGLNAKDFEYILRMARYIKQIDGKDVDEGKAQGFVENMTGMDSAYFWESIDDSMDCGVDTLIEAGCPNCGEEFEMPIAIGPEFFRPKSRGNRESRRATATATKEE